MVVDRPKARPAYVAAIETAFRVHPVVALLGPRQVGKTTLARWYQARRLEENPSEPIHYFDLEDPSDLALFDSPKLLLAPLSGLIIIDEIQLKPDLFPLIRVLVDESANQRSFLMLGSASRDLLQQSSESLAGRFESIEVSPFDLFEYPDWLTLWLRGGYPKATLAADDAAAGQWLRAYIKTYLEQDIPNLGINIPTQQLRRFWLMLTTYHGNIINYSELGRSMGLSDKTVKYYADLLLATFMIRLLPPWYENVGKRQVRRPKLYFRDSGVLHALSDINSAEALRTDKLVGASWEGFALESIIRASRAPQESCYFWATQSGAELDLLIVKGRKKYAYEFKYTDTPKMTKSMYASLESLQLDQIQVIAPEARRGFIHEKVEVLSLSAAVADLGAVDIRP